MDISQLADAILGNGAYDVIKTAIKRILYKEHLSKEDVIHALNTNVDLIHQFYQIHNSIENHFINTTVGGNLHINNNMQTDPNFMPADELVSVYNQTVADRDNYKKSAEDFYGGSTRKIYTIIAIIVFALITFYGNTVMVSFNTQGIVREVPIFLGMFIGLWIIRYYAVNVHSELEREAKLYEIYKTKAGDLHRQGVFRGVIRPEDTIQ